MHSIQYVNRVQDFYRTLQELYSRDHEQELIGGSLEVYRDLLLTAKSMHIDEDLIARILSNIDFEGFGHGEYPRVSDAMIVVKSIWSGLGTGRSL